MASRENTTIQVALILSVMCTITLGVFTYMFFNKAKTSEDKLVQLQNTVNIMTNKNSVNETRIKALKYMMGDPTVALSVIKEEIKKFGVGGELSGLETLLTNFESDMELYGQGIPEETRSYISIPATLLETIKQQNDSYTKLHGDYQRMKKKQEDTVFTEAAKSKKAIDAQEVADNELQKERAKFNMNFQRITAEKAEQAQSAQAQVIAANETRDLKVREVAGLAKENTTLVSTLEAMKIQRQPKSERFEVPDGRITMIQQQNSTVWIDLGAFHGLRELTTFAVYDIKEPGVMHEKSDIKAKIQVTRILDDRLAEARILDDSVTNPILRGDLIHSPVFQSATQIHFALAGFFDLDSDGKNDFNKVKSMISAMGGVIDAEIRPDGTREGKITPNTRYLLKGTTKDLISTKGYNELLREVQFYDVEQITFPTFLKFVGYKREVLSTTLGRSADSSQFLGDLENREIAPRLLDETRKERFPPRRGQNGAFK
jgi:hypothetical protein